MTLQLECLLEVFVLLEYLNVGQYINVWGNNYPNLSDV